MTVEAIKELKRDIISGFDYRNIEVETSESYNYRCENLIFEDGKICYHCYEHLEDGMEGSGGSILYSTVEEFLKKEVEEILANINACYYYDMSYCEGDC